MLFRPSMSGEANSSTQLESNSLSRVNSTSLSLVLLVRSPANYKPGIAYQLTGADPLIDTAQCTRDAALMKTLGANAIRVYHVDSSANHDGCMEAFANNGIYLFVDLDTFNTWLTPVCALLSPIRMILTHL